MLILYRDHLLVDLGHSSLRGCGSCPALLARLINLSLRRGLLVFEFDGHLLQRREKLSKLLRLLLELRLERGVKRPLWRCERAQSPLHLLCVGAGLPRAVTVTTARCEPPRPVGLVDRRRRRRIGGETAHYHYRYRFERTRRLLTRHQETVIVQGNRPPQRLKVRPISGQQERGNALFALNHSR